MNKLRIAVLASGRGSNLQSIIDNAESGRLDAQISCVVSYVENARALERAKTHGVEALYFNPEGKEKEEYYSEIAGALEKRGVQLVVLAGFMRIIPASFVKRFENKIINIHPSLLPSFPGLHPQKQALDAGVKESGCTVHFVSEQVDGGPAILQARVPVLEGDSEEALTERILGQEHKILPKAIELIAEGRVKIENGKVIIDWNGFQDKWNNGLKTIKPFHFGPGTANLSKKIDDILYRD